MAQRSSWEGKKRKVLPVPHWSLQGGRLSGHVLGQGGLWGHKNVQGEASLLRPPLWQLLCTSYAHSPPNCLKTWLGKKWKDNQVFINTELVK